MTDFNEITRIQTDLFFNELLPRYIHLFFRGRGYYFVRKMLYDLDNNRILDILKQKIEVTPELVEKSLNIKKICPVRICREAQFGPKDSIVLGHFSHVERYSSSGFAPNSPFIENPASEYKTVYESKSIALFEGSFNMLGISDEKQLSYQVLKTIFHEYIHFFETYFLRSEQMLTSREEPPQGLTAREYSLDEAAGMDKRYIISSYLREIIFWTVLLAMLYIIFYS
ncbi:MAG TPA: hypothetical protein PK467_17510 [Candidatus Wallbacteria bacterium]|nr:hypothetical protein [Candidatus Wallbacteria bacterium]